MKRVLPLLSLLCLFWFTNSCQKELSCQQCGESNQPPVANAGVDQTITLPADSVLLDGSASTDPDGTVTAYSWKQVAGSVQAQLSDSGSVKVKSSRLQGGLFHFELTVTDNRGAWAKDTVQITVLALSGGTVINRPPVACAGADQVLQLPNNHANLDASCSTDPENNISSFSWKLISGKPGVNIATPKAIQTAVTNLEAGTFLLELTVTDSAGLFSRDTVRIQVLQATSGVTCLTESRPVVNAKLISIGTLSEPKAGMAVAAVGGKIIYAGGMAELSGSTAASTRVDIYNVGSNTWSTAELSAARFGLTLVVAGTKVFFAGGYTNAGLAKSAVVDIFDVATNTWSVASLSQPRSFIGGAAVGNKVVFAGGVTAEDEGTKRVDIYDIPTNTWSTSELRVARVNISGVSINNKIYLAGGEEWFAAWPPYSLKNIDIYDASTNIWSVSSLAKADGGLAGMAVGPSIYWAGGCTVEIRNWQNGSTTFATLSHPRGWANSIGQNVVKRNNELIFFSHYVDPTRFDIYNLSTGAWSIGSLPLNNIKNASIICVDNIIYLAGGYIGNTTVATKGVWKLEF